MSKAPPQAGFRCLSRTDSVPWADPQRPGWRTTSLMVAVRHDRAGNRLHRLLTVRIPVLAGSCSTWRWSRSSSACTGTSVPMKRDVLPKRADAAGGHLTSSRWTLHTLYAFRSACVHMVRTVWATTEPPRRSISRTFCYAWAACFGVDQARVLVRRSNKWNRCSIGAECV